MPGAWHKEQSFSRSATSRQALDEVTPVSEWIMSDEEEAESAGVGRAAERAIEKNDDQTTIEEI